MTDDGMGPKLKEFLVYEKRIKRGKKVLQYEIGDSVWYCGYPAVVFGTQITSTLRIHNEYTYKIVYVHNDIRTTTVLAGSLRKRYRKKFALNYV